MRPPRRIAGPRTAAAGTSGISDSGGVTHGPGRRPLVRGGVMHAPPRRRGADGLRGEANPLQAVCGGVRRQAATDARRVRAMRRISPSCGQARSCRVFPRRNGGTRTRGLAAPSRARCQLRHIPKPSPSSPGAEAPMGQKGGWRHRTPAGTRTRIDGCDILPRLMRGGGFLLKNPFGGFSIDRLSPHALWFARFYESCRSISLLPSSRMFRAAFTSRSCRTPQDGHAHSRTDRFLTCGFR